MSPNHIDNVGTRVWPEWKLSNGVWLVLQVCRRGHARFWRPTTTLCEVVKCLETCRRLWPSELAMYMVGGEAAILSYYQSDHW